MDKNKQLEHARVYLISEYPFYSAMLNQCVFSWNNKIPTAGVCINKVGNVELVINPEFFDKLSEHHRIGLLMHEMLHIAMNHLTRVEEYNKLYNIAMDISINQYIHKDFLPTGALLPDQYKLMPMKSFEYYYNELKKQPKEPQGDPMDQHGTKPNDDDKGSSEEVELSNEVKEKIVEKLVGQAKAEAEAVKPGSTPNHINEELTNNLIEQAKINWKNALKTYIGKHFSNDKDSTRNRPNRRLGLSAAGKRSVEYPKLLIAVDQSGSITNDMIAEFFNEIKAILNNGKDKTEVAFFDTEVAHSIVLNKFKTMPKRYANGGTDFQPVIEYANKKRPDLLIMFTDGEAPNPMNAKMPLLWVITGAKNEELKGKKIYLKG